MGKVVGAFVGGGTRQSARMTKKALLRWQENIFRWDLGVLTCSPRRLFLYQQVIHFVFSYNLMVPNVGFLLDGGNPLGLVLTTKLGVG